MIGSGARVQKNTAKKGVGQATRSQITAPIRVQIVKLVGPVGDLVTYPQNALSRTIIRESSVLLLHESSFRYFYKFVKLAPYVLL